MNKKMDLFIRDARDDERPAIKALTLTAYEEYTAVMPPSFWEAYRQQLLMSLDEEGQATCIVAEYEGAIVGSVLLYPPQVNAYTGIAATTAWPEVRLLAVVPAVRGQGVGSALMDECERRARQAGATHLGLHTMDMMQAALRLYEHRGFIRAPELDFHPVKGVVVKAYRLNL